MKNKEFELSLICDRLKEWCNKYGYSSACVNFKNNCVSATTDPKQSNYIKIVND